MKSQDTSLISKGQSYFIFVLLFLLYLFDQADRYVITSLFPYLQADWGLSDTQCGLLVSAVFWSLLIFTIPVSYLIDRWSRKKSIGIMAIAWSVATGICAFTSNFAQLFTARAFIGIGEAGYASGGMAIISGLFSEKKRGLLIGLWLASVPLGGAIGVMVGGLVAAAFGWRHAFGLVALPGLLLGILFFFTKDYKTVELVKTKQDDKQAREKTKMSSRDIAYEFVNKPSLVLNYLAYAASIFVTVALLTWLPTFFHRVENIPMAQASVKGAAVMLTAIIGAPIGGLIADRWLRKKGSARMLISGIAAIVTALVLFLAFTVVTGTLQYILLLLAGVTIAAVTPGASAVTQDLVHPGLRATSFSVSTIVQHLLGSTLGPVFVGALSDLYNISTALSYLPIFSVASAALFFIGSFYYDRDYEKVERIELQIIGADTGRNKGIA